MARLASCWLLVESFVIPHGFLKWFYLSFYVHPIFLVFCQLFLWLNELIKLLIYLFYPLKLGFRLSFFIFRLIKRAVHGLLLFSYKVDDVFYDALLPLQDYEIVVSCRKSTHSPSRQETRAEPGVVDTYEATKEVINNDICVKDSWLNEYLYSDHYSSSIFMTYDVNSGTDQLLPDHQHTGSTPSFRFSFLDQIINNPHETDQDSAVISPSNGPDLLFLEDMLLTMSPDDSSDSPIRPLKQQLITSREAEDIDPFHSKYTSRMRFFNVLYHERLHGINAILNEHLSAPIFSNCIEQSEDYSRQYRLWSRMARKRVLRSLECDLEIICVAQCCLFWEALDHQYHKVEALALSDNAGNLAFHHNISGKFQELQIHLERFVEDQRLECQGSSNNTSKRLSFQGLLQVPDVTGFVFMEEENKMMSQEYSTRPTQMLEAIDNCIKAFWLYIKTYDQNKSFWKYKGIWRTHPPVEDPQDLVLLYQVMKNLHKKGIMLRGVQGKSKCWVRRKVKPMQEENDKRNLVFAMIDMKLVKMMLKMSLVSRSHLKWCQEKLDNLDFMQDKVCRGLITHLFPSY
ncbi:hypothetical protein C2S53_010019 [Perilla frutescens var. hirtella]|uniref:Uncharacterized protein n=1 Tax=Perilla frutescens var. hirtella TaxID=608512 RepID=A0AAD4NX25_PERFH|nr:hypothetical protein C2S53_010019 [Perilla frutescens var. hirtella]